MGDKTMGSLLPDTSNGEKGDALESLVGAFSGTPELASDNAYTKYFGVKWKRKSPFSILEYITDGIPLTSAETLAEHMGVEAKTLFIAYIGMSDSTVRRRLKDEYPRLTTDESDKAVRYAHLLGLATNLMEGNEEAAREWLDSPAHALGDRTPYDMATTEAGARRVEDLIISLEYGMFN